MQKMLMSSTHLKPSPIRLVIFDLDGTLVDAFPAITDSINHMMKRLGHPEQSLRKVKRSVGWGVGSLVRTFVPEEKVEEALSIFRGHHDKRLRRPIRLLDGVKTLLPFLKRRGCVLAIASNRPEEFCRIILDVAGIGHYFDFVVCSDMVKRAKPYPDMVRNLLRKARVPARQTMFVGDMTVDVACGRAAGVMTVAVSTGSCSWKELEAENPDWLVRRISLVRALLGHQKF
ncbi:MAG: HAD family hydrolase [Candidatus Omnitrophota bacterium]